MKWKKQTIPSRRKEQQRQISQHLKIYSISKRTSRQELMEDMDIEQRTSPKQTQHIQWDEETIAEHDKDRGTRQKVESNKLIQNLIMCRFLSHQHRIIT